MANCSTVGGTCCVVPAPTFMPQPLPLNPDPNDEPVPTSLTVITAKLSRLTVNLLELTADPHSSDHTSHQAGDMNSGCVAITVSTPALKRDRIIDPLPIRARTAVGLASLPFHRPQMSRQPAVGNGH